MHKIQLQNDAPFLPSFPSIPLLSLKKTFILKCVRETVNRKRRVSLFFSCFIINFCSLCFLCCFLFLLPLFFLIIRSIFHIRLYFGHEMSTKMYVKLFFLQLTTKLIVLEQICIEKHLQSLKRVIKQSNIYSNISYSFGEHQYKINIS